MLGARLFGYALAAAVVAAVPAGAQQQPAQSPGASAPAAANPGAGNAAGNTAGNTNAAKPGPDASATANPAPDKNPAANPPAGSNDATKNDASKAAATQPSGASDANKPAPEANAAANPPAGANNNANNPAPNSQQANTSAPNAPATTGAATGAATNTAANQTPAANENGKGPSGQLEKVHDAWRAGKLIGATVYNSKGDKIGTIDDLMVGNDGKISDAVIAAGGGLLGIGSKLVSVPFDQLKFEESVQDHPASATAPSGGGAGSNGAPGATTGNASSHPTQYSIVLPDATKQTLTGKQEFKYAG